MNLFQVFIRFASLFVLIEDVVSQRTNGSAPYYVKTNSMVCYGNPEMLVNITCRLKPINWEKTVALMDSDLVGVIRNATLRLQLFKFTNQFRPFLWNITFNLCQMLETRKGNPYGKVFVNVFSHFTSINHSCPYWGHLAAFGICLDSRFVPFILPSGTYKIACSFYDGWPLVHIGTAEVIASVVNRNYMERTIEKKIREDFADT